MTKPETPLLTIAIPTYNRAGYLDACLEQIAGQIVGNGSMLEVLLSNNNSTDSTEEVVAKFVDRGVPITYFANSENIGGERNVIQCYKLARGKYVLIIGDDDLLLDGALAKILQVLAAGEYGLVYLQSYGFADDHLAERPAKTYTGLLEFTDAAAYLEKVSYWITFLSGNIVNKSLVKDDVDPERFSGSNLPQLSWFIPAIYKAKKNAFFKDTLIAFKAFNTGGYRLCQVFGENLNQIFDYFIEKGYSRKPFDQINTRLLQLFFPNLILILRKQAKGFNFESEDSFTALRKVFSGYPSFWLVTVPVIKLPYRAAKIWAMVTARMVSR